jgi:hypothetical protein
MPDPSTPSNRWARRRGVIAGTCALLAAALAATPALAAPVDTVPETVPETVPVPTLADPPADAGSVEIITPQGEPLTSGGSTTLYSLKLPDGAACPGDTASGNWLIQSFLIPFQDDAGAIKYGVAGPEGTQFALYSFDTKPYAHQPTQVSASPDDPGVIPLLPGLTFAVFEPGYVPPGTYKIGVACTFFRQTALYWDTEIVIEANPDDEPSQLTWRVPSAEPFQPSDGSSRNWFLIAGIAAALIAAAVLLWQSRSGSQRTPSDTPPSPRQPDSSSKDSR